MTTSTDDRLATYLANSGSQSSGIGSSFYPSGSQRTLRLPTQWNNRDRIGRVEIREQGTLATMLDNISSNPASLIHERYSESQQGIVRANHYIPRSTGVFYFEVQIVNAYDAVRNPQSMFGSSTRGNSSGSEDDMDAEAAGASLLNSYQRYLSRRMSAPGSDMDELSRLAAHQVMGPVNSHNSGDGIEGATDMVCVGLCTKNADFKKFFGETEHLYGYASDGSVLCKGLNPIGLKGKMAPFSYGDVIGVCVHFSYIDTNNEWQVAGDGSSSGARVTFTRNGVPLGVEFLNVRGHLYPCVGFRSKSGASSYAALVRFDQKGPFRFDLQNHLLEERQRLHNCILESPLPLSDEKHLNEIVLQYLISQGYTNTADRFGEVIGRTRLSTEKKESMEKRRQLMNEIRQGNMSRVHDAIDQMYPDFFDQYPVAQFWILTQQFVEMLRANGRYVRNMKATGHKVQPKDAPFPMKVLTDFVEEHLAPLFLYLRDGPLSESTEGSVADGAETRSLSTSSSSGSSNADFDDGDVDMGNNQSEAESEPSKLPSKPKKPRRHLFSDAQKDELLDMLGILAFSDVPHLPTVPDILDITAERYRPVTTPKAGDDSDMDDEDAQSPYVECNERWIGFAVQMGEIRRRDRCATEVNRCMLEYLEGFSSTYLERLVKQLLGTIDAMAFLSPSQSVWLNGSDFLC